MKIDTDILKSLFHENWSYVLNAVLLIMLYLSFGVSDSKDGIISSLKKEAKELIASADKYVAKNNALNDKITLLENQKQKVKTEIVYVQNKTKSDIKKVPALNTRQIANYYQERYKLPVTITQYGVALSDTIAKKNITELIEKDGCFTEIKLVKTELKIEESKGIVKDTIIGNLTSANVDLHKAAFVQKKIIFNVEKSLQKEKAKKTFWKVASGIILTGAGYLLIVN